MPTAQPDVRPADIPDDLVSGPSLRRTVNFEKAVGLYGRTTVEHIADHYNRGDELGYAAYAALHDLGGSPAEGRALYAKALEEGIDSLVDPPAALVELFKSVDTVPDWVDWDQLERGSIAYWRAGKMVVMCLAYAAIGAGFRTYGGTRPLVLSRRLIERDQVGRRLIETLRWAANASKPNGMRRFEDGFRLTMNVRMIHGAVRYHLSRSADWDWNDWGVPVDNVDALYTMGCLFTEAVVDALRKVGINLSDREVDDIIALWRYIGYVMGIPDDINFTDWKDLKTKSAIVRMLEHPADQGCVALMKSLTDYICEEKIQGYEVLPPFIDKRLGPDQKKVLTYGLMRAWAGDDICDQLGLPNNSLRHLVKIARPFVSTYDRVTRILPHDDGEKAAEALRAFGVALALKDGDPEVAGADEVTDSFERNSSKASEILHA
ncbi:oxygenase MpaB family protein [Pseudonocardia xishanensis]|uniref:ER-bound oxygenase mpaB/mpaB'/Rubber oxygenase catalytic domain-containing protein n=1 Tax=Pseudonocardia xishanensis TaxID=630995 RepID=A0ABP8RVJ4_9PSEU